MNPRAPTIRYPSDRTLDLPTDLDTPAALVDLPVLLRNLERLAGVMTARGQVLRPHVKTHSATEVARMQLRHGAVGLTVGTLRMAEAFAGSGFDDLFIASPIWATGSVATRLLALNDAIELTVGVDSAVSARLLADAVRGSGRRLGVVIEIDSGGHRSGVEPSQAAGLARAASTAGLDIRGVFTHPGHGYASPAAAREAAVDEARALEDAANSLREAGYDVPVLSAGSTPTVWHTPAGAVTEQRPGTYVFNDRQQIALGAAGLEDVAFMVAATVTSTAVPGQVVVNAGAKALSKERPELLSGHGTVLGYPDSQITQVTDFHGVIETPPGLPRPGLGEVVAIVPNHVCAAVNLARELLVMEHGQVTAKWAIDGRG